MGLNSSAAACGCCVEKRYMAVGWQHVYSVRCMRLIKPELDKDAAFSPVYQHATLHTVMHITIAEHLPDRLLATMLNRTCANRYSGNSMCAEDISKQAMLHYQ